MTELSYWGDEGTEGLRKALEKGNLSISLSHSLSFSLSISLSFWLSLYKNKNPNGSVFGVIINEIARNW